MNKSLHSFGILPVFWRWITTDIIYSLRDSQLFLIKFKLKPSSPELFESSHCHIAALTSSSIKLNIELTFSSIKIVLNLTFPNLTPKSFVALNISSKSFFASLLTSSSHTSPSNKYFEFISPFSYFSI